MTATTDFEHPVSDKVTLEHVAQGSAAAESFSKVKIFTAVLAVVMMVVPLVAAHKLRVQERMAQEIKRTSGSVPHMAVGERSSRTTGAAISVEGSTR